LRGAIGESSQLRGRGTPLGAAQYAPGTMRGSLTLRVASCLLLLGALASCLGLPVVRVTFTGDYPPLDLVGRHRV